MLRFMWATGNYEGGEKRAVHCSVPVFTFCCSTYMSQLWLYTKHDSYTFLPTRLWVLQFGGLQMPGWTLGGNSLFPPRHRIWRTTDQTTKVQGYWQRNYCLRHQHVGSGVGLTASARNTLIRQCMLQGPAHTLLPYAVPPNRSPGYSLPVVYSLKILPSRAALVPP